MIGFATPLAAIGFATVAGLAALYCFRRRSPPRTVSSLILWPPGAEQNLSARERSRLRPPPIFFLELLALIALAFAALSPFVRRPGGGTLHVLRDVSPSMSAPGVAARAERAIDNACRGRADGAVAYHEASDDAELARLVAALASARAPGDEILVVTDHASEDGALAPGIRWEAVGEPLANLAITGCRRSRREPGRDSVFIEVRRFGGNAPGATLTLDGTRRKPLAFDAEGVARLTLDAPANGTLTATLSPGGALAFDDTVRLAPCDLPALAVALSFTNSPLERLVRRALDATGFVSNYVAATEAEAVFTDCDRRDPEAARKLTVRFLPSGTTRSRARVWADPSESLLDGIALDGDAYALSPLPAPGRPIALLGRERLVTRDERQVTLAFSDPTLPFFRSPAFPALMQNCLALAHGLKPHEREAPPPDAAESDLTRCATGSFGSGATDADAALTRRPLAGLFALVALAALAFHAFLVRRRATSVLIALTALALARPVVPIPSRGGTLVVLADRSLSMSDAAKAEEERTIRALEATRPKGAELGVVAFGAEAAVEKRPEADGFEGFLRDLDCERSELTPALARAVAIAEPEAPLRSLVLSDGLVTGEARTGISRPMPIDSLYLPRPFANDLAVLSVDAPARVAPHAVIPVTAWVGTPVTTTNAYTLKVGSRTLASGRRVFREGMNPLTFRDFASGPSLRRYTLEIESASADPCRENNRAEFLVQVEGRRPVLLLHAPGEATAAETLARAGVNVEAHEANAFTPDLTALAGYAGVILENLPAKAFPTTFQRALRAYVTDLGGALAMTGGERAFGPGGWHATTVEEILPVSLELRQEHRKYALALAVVMDRSGSMAATLGNGRTKMDMANLGAYEAVKMLTPMDEIAVIAVDSAPHVVLGLQPADHAQRSPGQILGIRSMGGGIFVEQGLLAALRELKKSKSPIRHIILFADADDAEEPGDYQDYLETAAKAGITVSVIGLGRESDSDAELLKGIAEAGGGECWFESNAEEIPRLFMQDTFITARTAMCTNRTALVATEALRQLSDTLPAALPDIGGYNLTYIRDGAETAIRTADEDRAPLLAFRRVGLGRTLAFTGELSGPHAAPLMTSEVGAELAAAIGRWLGNADETLEGFTFDERLGKDGLAITATADAGDAASALAGGKLRLSALIERPDGETGRRDATFEWTAADTLTAILPLGGNDIAFPVVRFPNGRHHALAPTRLIHAPEYARPVDPDTGRRTLERLGETTGGRLLATADGIWDALPRIRRKLQLSPCLYLFVAVAFLALVFERRLGISFAAFLRRRAPRRKATAQGGETPRAKAPRATVGREAGGRETQKAETQEPKANATISALAAARRRLGK